MNANFLGMRPHLLLLLLLPLTNLGCITAWVWEDGLRAEMTAPEIVGVAGEGAQRRLVAGYQGGGSHYTLPADGDGRVCGAVVYSGFARTAPGIAKDLSPAQRQALRSFAFGNRHRISSPAFTWNPWEARQQSIDVQAGDLRCVAIAVGTDDRPLPLRDNCTLVDDARIVLLPATLPRPPADRAWGVAGAMMATPLTLAADAIFMPVLAICYVADGAGL
jgi:hypothetical protein